MALRKCPECGHEISDKALHCVKCGCPIKSDSAETIKLDSEKKQTLPTVTTPIKTTAIDCQACKQEKVMLPTKISRMSPVVVAIGWILTVPSILGIFFAILVFISTMQVSVASGTASTGTNVATGIGVIVAVVIGIISLVIGLLGYILIMKKKVYKCSACGYVLDRA
ncbi:MAG: zinc ribbon domain-containing protein [Elusimicrobia bacterium]|nr:zinc ribbon domain-containing protein [Elusimicrobiota bacterium]